MLSSTVSNILVSLCAGHIVAAAPLASSLKEPCNMTKAAVSTGRPFEMPTNPARAAIEAHHSNWPVLARSPAPTWSAVPPLTPTPQPLVPTPIAVAMAPETTWKLTPTPSYTWEETHDDPKNTNIHYIIAGVVVGLFFVIGFVGVVVTVILRKCRNPIKEASHELGEMGKSDRSASLSGKTSLSGGHVQPRSFIGSRA